MCVGGTLSDYDLPQTVAPCCMYVLNVLCVIVKYNYICNIQCLFTSSFQHWDLPSEICITNAIFCSSHNYVQYFVKITSNCRGWGTHFHCRFLLFLLYLVSSGELLFGLLHLFHFFFIWLTVHNTDWFHPLPTCISLNLS